MEQGEKKTFVNIIGGEERESTDCSTLDVVNPVTGEVYATSPNSGDEDVDAVHADNLRAHRLGINGVPCFVVAGRHAVAGAQ